VKEFTGTWIHVFLPSFAEIDKAEVTKRVRGIHHEKGRYFPTSLWLLEQSRQKFYRITLSPFQSFCQILSKFVQFSKRDISENVFQTHHNIGVKPVGFSPTIARVHRFWLRDRLIANRCRQILTRRQTPSAERHSWAKIACCSELFLWH